MKAGGSPLKLLVQQIIDLGVIDAIGDGVSIHDMNFRILYQNDKAVHIIGEHTGEYCYKAFEGRSEVCEECPLALTLKDGKVRTIERQNPVRTGLIVEITTSAIKDPEGNIIAGMEVVRDITGRKRLEDEKNQMIVELREAAASVKTLKGLLPVCASCNMIRDEDGKWHHVDAYIRDHSEAEITHGYCPDCAKKHFPDNYPEED